ncbi:TetR/AcrR family transcriptional regulator [Consotaella aegiceratis]|uniref:TetR/AcrR family transcriptional regulator n=1 Tax=Consotaella aegiceratis TaxID=3097961 RepID=UPI002F401768
METTESPARAPAGHDPAKRLQILEGAKAVFDRMGFDAASMNDICHESGVSKSTLYVYFRSKEELFAALVSEMRDRKIEMVAQTLDDPTDPAGVLMRMGVQLAKIMTSPHTMRANRTIIAVATRMPEIGQTFYTEGPVRGSENLTRYLEKAVAAGTLKIDDPRMAAAQFGELALAGMFRCRLFLGEVEPPSEEEIERTVKSAVRLFMAGYGVDRTGEKSSAG